MEISCIILAGGKSERIGKDKAFLMLNDKFLISHVLETVEKIFDDVIIVVKNKDQRRKLEKITDSKVVEDKNKIYSPIAGIGEGIKHIKNDYFFLTACDMPFLDEKFIKKLISKIDKKDCTVPFLKGYEPFCAIYKKNLFKNCDINQSISEIIDKSDKIAVKPTKRGCLNFFNVNSYKDLKKAYSTIVER